MFEVIGIQRREYTSKKTGALVRGYNVFVTFEDRNIDGVGCESIWLNDSMFDDAGGLSVGDSINVHYNRYGRVNKIEVI